LSGAKRGPIEIRDLDADDDDFGDGGQGRGEQQASKRARVEQQEHVANGDPVQRQQQQVAPWESEEHRRAVDNVTPLQVRVNKGSVRMHAPMQLSKPCVCIAGCNITRQNLCPTLRCHFYVYAAVAVLLPVCRL
jgi:hypothetical protein